MGRPYVKWIAFDEPLSSIYRIECLKVKDGYLYTVGKLVIDEGGDERRGWRVEKRRAEDGRAVKTRSRWSPLYSPFDCVVAGDKLVAWIWDFYVFDLNLKFVRKVYRRFGENPSITTDGRYIYAVSEHWSYWVVEKWDLDVTRKIISYEVDLLWDDRDRPIEF
ncbi:MAG: hypothetical protein ACP5MH_11555, partial [Thermoproteus sp.]